MDQIRLAEEILSHYQSFNYLLENSYSTTAQL